jgi:hypothetical protein
VVLSNTGGLAGRGVSEPLAAALLRRLLGLPDAAIRADILVRLGLSWLRRLVARPLRR